MTGCQTILTFNDYESKPFKVTNGLNQGDPLSSALCSFYHTDLIEPTSDPNELKSVFVDDTMFFVAGITYEENNTKLTNMMTQRNGAADWSKMHNSNSKVDKFALLHLSCKHKQDLTHPGKQRPISCPPLTLTNHTINPSISHKFLSIFLDQTLNFKEQANYALGKGEKYAAQIRRLSQNHRSVLSLQAQRLHNSVIMTKMVYAAEV